MAGKRHALRLATIQDREAAADTSVFVRGFGKGKEGPTALQAALKKTLEEFGPVIKVALDLKQVGNTSKVSTIAAMAAVTAMMASFNSHRNIHFISLVIAVGYCFSWYYLYCSC